MKILITGANGQLGRAFSKTYPESIALDREGLDLSWDSQQIINAIKSHEPEVIINCAAYTKVDQAEKEPDIAKKINSEAVGALAEASNELNASLIHFSTDYIFDGTKGSPYNESDNPNPKSLYGQSKLDGEHEAAKAGKHSVIRLSYVFGDGANLIKALLGAADKFAEIKAITDQSIRPTYSEDTASAVKHLLDTADSLPPILHLQNSGPLATIYDLASEIYRQAEKSTKINKVTLEEYFSGKEVAERPKYSIFDLSLAESLGIKMRDWREALADYLKAIQ